MICGQLEKANKLRVHEGELYKEKSTRVVFNLTKMIR